MGATALVAGASAEEIDYVDLTNRYLPIVFAFVLGLSLVLLMVAFRSLVVPVKAILLNLLSAAAAYGLLVIGSTGRIITGAALIIVAVFVGFAMGDMVMFQHMGFGVAVALLLDATVIRSILVPARMKLLGDWNWYFPSWLEWLPRSRSRAAVARARRRPRSRRGRAGSSAVGAAVGHK